MSDDLITYVIGQLRGAYWEEEAAAVEALVERIEQLERERDEALAAQSYTYIGKDMKPILARDLEDAKDAAEAKLAVKDDRIEELKAKLVEAEAVAKIWREDFIQENNRWVDALRKLDKAAEIGNKMAKSIMVNHYIPSVVAEWNAVLAELRGKENE